MKLDPGLMLQAADDIGSRVTHELPDQISWFVTPGPPGISHDAEVMLAKTAGNLGRIKRSEIALASSLRERARMIRDADRPIDAGGGGVFGSSKGTSAKDWAHSQSINHPVGPSAADRRANGWANDWTDDLDGRPGGSTDGGGWYYDCIKFASLAWIAGGLRLPSSQELPTRNANDFAEYFKRTGKLSSTGVPPAGAMVFYDVSAFGHVAIADGEGGVYSTVNPTQHSGNQIAHLNADKIPARWTSSYMGWSLG